MQWLGWLRRWKAVDWLLTRLESYWALLDQLGAAQYVEVAFRLAVAAMLGGWTYISVEVFPIAITCGIVVFASLMSLATLRSILSNQRAAINGLVPLSRTDVNSPLQENGINSDYPSASQIRGREDGLTLLERRIETLKEILDGITDDLRKHGESAKESASSFDARISSMATLCLSVAASEINSVRTICLDNLLREALNLPAPDGKLTIEGLEHFAGVMDDYIQDVKRLEAIWKIPGAGDFEDYMRNAEREAEEKLTHAAAENNIGIASFSAFRRYQIALAKMRVTKEVIARQRDHVRSGGGGYLLMLMDNYSDVERVEGKTISGLLQSVGVQPP